jgi:hypothetical protein
VRKYGQGGGVGDVATGQVGRGDATVDCKAAVLQGLEFRHFLERTCRGAMIQSRSIKEEVLKSM